MGLQLVLVVSPSSCGENHPYPKSGQDLDPDKPGSTTSCRGDETNPNVLRVFFWIFCPQVPTFVTDSRVIESVVGSAPVGHPHMILILPKI